MQDQTKSSPKIHKYFLNKKVFAALSKNFPAKFRKNLFLADCEGRILIAEDCVKIEASALKTSIFEALRWGECNVFSIGDEAGAIVAPILLNSELIGAFGCFGEKLFCVSEEFSSDFIMETSQKLLNALERENATNASLLAANREAMQRGRISAEFLHETKKLKLKSLRDAYMFREDSLLSAIKGGNRELARKYLNEILIYIYGQYQNRPELIKAHMIEMSVMMIRGAIEHGVSKIEAFENSYKMLAELSVISDEEAMCVIIIRLLESVIDNIENSNSSNSEKKFKSAMKYLRENFSNPLLTRKMLAEYLRISERQLTELFKKFTAKGFSENLAQLRISRACELMLLNSTTATEVAYEVGFSDQSYFSKIFKKHTKLTPSDFRKKML